MSEDSTSSVEEKQYGRGEHPNSRKNLKPFLPGQNGNPHPGYPLKERLQDALRRKLQEPSADAPAGEHIVYATLIGAQLREPTPLREVWDRTEGKTPLAITGPGGGPIEIKTIEVRLAGP